MPHTEAEPVRSYFYFKFTWNFYGKFKTLFWFFSIYFYALTFYFKHIIVGCDVKDWLQSPQRSILTLNVRSKLDEYSGLLPPFWLVLLWVKTNYQSTKIVTKINIRNNIRNSTKTLVICILSFSGNLKPIAPCWSLLIPEIQTNSPWN